MRIPENLCMLLPKALKMRAIKQTMALITDSIGRTKCAPAMPPWTSLKKPISLSMDIEMPSPSILAAGQNLQHIACVIVDYKPSL